MIKVLAITNPTEKKVCATLAVAVFVLMLAYTYFVAATVFHVTARKDVQYKTQLAASYVADLEAAYLKESVVIARGAIEEFSLTPVSKKHFVRIAPGRTLTLYDES